MSNYDILMLFRRTLEDIQSAVDRVVRKANNHIQDLIDIEEDGIGKGEDETNTEGR